MKKFTLIVVVIQVIVLVFIAGKREWIIANGESVFLRTAPVDPRDIFRGDYVRLDYELAQHNSALITDKLKTDEYHVIYASLKKDERGVAQIIDINFEQPEGLFIKGYLNDNGGVSWRNRGRIKFGIEKYFVEQGEGISIEKIRGRASEWQSAMEMDVKLGSDGTAVIKGFRWSDIGVRLQMLEPGITVNNNIRAANNTNANTESNVVDAPTRLSPKLRISVRNQSEQLINFADSDEHCGFHLVKNQAVNSAVINSIKPVPFPNRQCSEANNWTFHQLKPDEVYSFEIDMADAIWFVDKGDDVVELGRLPENWQGYRWVYQLPKSFLEQHMGEGALWNSSLRTARFNATRRID